MFSKDFLSLFKEVAGSWQVIAVTISVILYISLVAYVGRSYRRRRKVSSKPRPKKKKAEPKAPVVSGDDLGDTTNEELGLE